MRLGRQESIECRRSSASRQTAFSGAKSSLCDALQRLVEIQEGGFAGHSVAALSFLSHPCHPLILRLPFRLHASCHAQLTILTRWFYEPAAERAQTRPRHSALFMRAQWASLRA